MTPSAIILAAGRGSRMGAATSNQTKCMTTLASKSLLQWQIEALKSAGIEEIAVVTGYLGDQLEKDAQSLGIAHFFNNPQWEKTNMVYTLSCAEDWLQSKTCVVSYSDIVYSAEIVRSLMSSTDNLSITYDTAWKSLWELRFDDIFSDAESFTLKNDGSLASIGEETTDLDKIQGQFMGLYQITPDGWNQIKQTLPHASKPIEKLDSTALLNDLIKQGHTISGIPVAGKWCEVDTQSDLAKYQKKVAEKNWSHDWR